MPLNTDNKKHHDTLKEALHKEVSASKFEHLAAILISRLLDLPIAVASSGFQYGADAGPAGQQERRFRLECKKYGSNTRLDDRELLGEIDQALARDESLEAWILVTTHNVREQTRQTLDQHGDNLGIPIVVIDWTNHEIAPLAALCTVAPDLVEKEFSKKAGAAANALRSQATDSVYRLQKNLQCWHLGFEKLRKLSYDRIDKIRSSPTTANAKFGQNVAGNNKRIKRNSIHDALDAWWQVSSTDTPAVIVGREGTGKTWATFDWLVDNHERQSIVLAIPSSSAVTFSQISETSIKTYLARYIHDLTQTRSTEHWYRRIDRLLKRPAEEGIVFTIFFDGLNQESSIDWLFLLKLFQDEPFSGRIRIIVSTRTHYFENILSSFHSLVIPVQQITIENFDTTPGGEFDQMLALEGLRREDLNPDIINWARNPRLFSLVIRFRDQLNTPEQITVHRLLWEYGRDSFGHHGTRSLREDEWKEWLRRLAQEHRNRVPNHTPYISTQSLSHSVGRMDHQPNQVYARLSDIIDGQFVIHDKLGGFQFQSAIVAHALGLALLSDLSRASIENQELDEHLSAWLDPISGFDERSEILRAAVSILVAQSEAASPLSGLLVTAWLQTQNVNDTQWQEIGSMAHLLTGALLDAVERSNTHVHTSARLGAVNALRKVPREDNDALATITARLRKWLLRISRDVRENSSTEYEQHRSRRLVSVIGTDLSSPITILGINFQLVDRDTDLVKTVIPSIIEGFPMEKFTPIFEAAAIEMTVRNHSECWDGLRWLCLLNELDPENTADKLRELSSDIRSRVPEPGLHVDFPLRIAALLLWLTGQEEDDSEAASIDPDFYRIYNYNSDYLPDPSASLFELERRHAEIVLNNTDIPVLSRVHRTKNLWLDPNFDPPIGFYEELKQFTNKIDLDKLNSGRDRMMEEHVLENIEPALARCAPDLLANLIRHLIRNVGNCPTDHRYWNVIRLRNYTLLVNHSDTEVIRNMRLSRNFGNEDEETVAANELLMIEIRDLEPRVQIDTLIRANIKFIYMEFTKILRPLDPTDIDELIHQYRNKSPKEKSDLIMLLSIHPRKLNDDAYSWIRSHIDLDHEVYKFRRSVFRILSQSDPLRFGRYLVKNGWSWNLENDVEISHYGTYALIEATLEYPFEQIVSNIAPWRLLEAVRGRDTKAAEVRVVANILSSIILAGEDEWDSGSNIFIDRTSGKFWPSISLRPSDLEANNLRLIFDIEAQNQALRRAAEVACERIQEARCHGADLHLMNFTADDLYPLLHYARESIDQWLQGFDELTTNFQHRVRLAEGFFLALCEALLAHEPDQGVRLWRALKSTIQTRFIGAIGIDEILHIIFRAPDTDASNLLRKEIMELKYCNTDQDMFDIVIAAVYNEKIDWLDEVIAEDKLSSLSWRRRRATILEGFGVNNILPVPKAWPDKEIRKAYEQLICKSARSKWIEGCAHFWWNKYINASDSVEAYAAWILFSHTADRRVLTWIDENRNSIQISDNFFENKIIHFNRNWKKIEQLYKKRNDKMSREFLTNKIIKYIEPWIN